MTPEMTRALVRSILANPIDHDWSIQGLGMLRTYLTDMYRLHVWSPEDATPNVSRLHDHPWDFTSYVVAGYIVNTRYSRVPAAIDHKTYLAPSGATKWQHVRIRCGPDGGVAGEPGELLLVANVPEEIKEGEWYAQHAHEIHDTVPAGGTVTIIRRTKLPDPDHANVYFPMGQPWVSAGGAVVASSDIVKRICDRALERWF